MMLLKFSFSQKVQLYACIVSLISLFLLSVGFIAALVILPLEAIRHPIAYQILVILTVALLSLVAAMVFSSGWQRQLTKEIQRRDEALSKSEERLNMALWGSNEVMFDWDISNQCWYFDENFEHLLGYPISDTPANKESYFNLINMEDVALVEEKLQAHLAGGTSYFEVAHRLKQQTWTLVLDFGKSKSGGA